MIRHSTIYSIVTSAILVLSAQAAHARISIEPFASISSTKTIKPNKAGKNSETPAATETSVTKQRTTYGVRGTIGMFSVFKFQLGVGTNELTTTSKVSQAVDDYEEIDYEKDLSMDTSDPASDVKVTERQKKGTATLIVDPSFSIFILRGKAGVIATQRELEKSQTGSATTKFTSPIKYKPTVGAGAGIKFGPRMYFIAEYSLFLYKFPEKAPFEREVTVTYGVSI